MRVGLIPFFGWMPHTAHFIYLTHALKTLGHQVETMTCNGQLATCYGIEAKGTGKKPLSCAKCRFSNAFVTAQSDQQTTFQKHASADPARTPRDWVHSSLRTLHRLEGDAELAELARSSQADQLVAASSVVFDAVRNWSRERRIDFVFLFNGRMDISHAALEALKQNDVPFASVERSFAGHGINILPDENCLGLQAVHRLTREARDTPLPQKQAYAAGKFLFDRLKGQTATEWRNYQKDATAGSWPLAAAGLRILILPSSMNEVQGSQDYTMDWASPTVGYEAVIAAAGVPTDQVVVRGHPNWAQNIGISQGHKINDYYTAWTQRQGYHYIGAESKVRTADLMRDADLILVSHSSAAYEAGSLRRNVIAIGTAHYTQAGFAYDGSTPDKLAQVMSDITLSRGMTMARSQQRRLLRYISTASQRIPMFAKTIVPSDARHCDMYPPQSLDRLAAVLAGAPLSLDPLDDTPSQDTEDAVLDLLDGPSWPEESPDDDVVQTGTSWPAYRGQWLLDMSRKLRR